MTHTVKTNVQKKWRQCLLSPDEIQTDHTSGWIKKLLSVFKQCRPSSLSTWHDHASKQRCEGFLFLFCWEVGQCFVRVDCVQGPVSSPSKTVMTQLSCRQISSQNAIFKGCEQVCGACTPQEKMNVYTVCCASKESLKKHLKIMIMHVGLCTALPILSVTVVTHDTKQMQLWSSLSRGKSDQGQRHANTGLTLQAMLVVLITLNAEHKTADLLKYFIG